jgi:hypothetical protein
MSTIRISGWRIGARTISAVTELRTFTALGHLGAKNVIYDIIGGVSVDVVPLQGIAAEDLAARLTMCGFVATVQKSSEDTVQEIQSDDLSSEPNIAA